MVKKAELVKFKNRSKTQALIEEAKRNMPIWVQQASLLAEMRMINYKAHIEQGFTKEQALFLCKET